MAYIKVLSATQVASNKIRLQFSQPVPYLTPLTGLQLKNYAVFDGATVIPIVKVTTVEDHYDSVDVEVQINLVEDTVYTVQVFNLYNQAGSRLENEIGEKTVRAIYMPPNSSTIKQETVESSLRKYMSPVLDGPNFRALLAGFATGEVANQTNAELAKDQLFYSTASGEYLDRIANNYGVSRPNVGMRDATFREYISSFYNFKVTEDALYRMIRVFYGIDGVQAYVANDGLLDPALPVNDDATGNTLILKLDGNRQITLNFFRDEYADYTNPTQVESAILISRKIQEQKAGGFALVAPPVPEIPNSPNPPIPAVPPTLRIYSATMGLRSSVEIVGGNALPWLNFSIQTKHLRSRNNVSYIGRDNTDTMRIFLHAISDAVRQTPENASYLGTNGWTFDPANRFALTAAETTLESDLVEGYSYSQIAVNDASQFIKLNENGQEIGGYISIGFGYDYEQGPVKYTQAIVSTTPNYLKVQGFVPTKTITAGPDKYVTLLNGNQGYQRANLSQTFGTPAGVPGSMYATNSNVARLACAAALLAIIDAGSKHKIQVVYPLGAGLLNGEVLEKSLVLSDLIRIYGPNDVVI